MIIRKRIYIIDGLAGRQIKRIIRIFLSLPLEEGEIYYMANKTVKFSTIIINDNKVYLKASDVAKALGYSNYYTGTL